MRCRRDLQSASPPRPALACLLVFRSAREARVRASHLCRPGVFNVLSISETRASPFCLNLIKAVFLPGLWPLPVWRRQCKTPRLRSQAWRKHAALHRRRDIGGIVCRAGGQKEAGILHNIKRVSFISIIRPCVLQISCGISCWCAGLKWQAYYAHYHLKAHVSFE